MARVHFTPALKRFVPGLEAIEVRGSTVADIMAGVEIAYPGLAAYLMEDNGALRQHVNIFINDSFIRDRTRLSDAVQPRDKVFIIQALSGG
ncbi:MAG: MoaD/ThiS family protein [Gammaproteobacteria bacterium]